MVNTDLSRTIHYAYDPNGNIQSKRIGRDIHQYDYEYDPLRPNLLKAVTLDDVRYEYTHDHNGNMLSGPNFADPDNVQHRQFFYQAANKVLAVYQGENDVHFWYDGNDRRIVKATDDYISDYYISDLFEFSNGPNATGPKWHVFANGERFGPGAWNWPSTMGLIFCRVLKSAAPGRDV